MPNPPLEQDWPLESRIVIDEDDIPAWERPAAPPAATPLEKFHRLTPQTFDPPPRETPDDRRSRTIRDIDGDLEAAGLALASALAWARSIGYHSEVIEPIESAAELVSKAQGLVDAFEVRS